MLPIRWWAGICCTARCSARSWTLANVLAVALHGNNRQPVFPPLNALLGVRAELAGVLAAVPDAIFTALLFFFMLFLLRLLLRKEWIAGAGVRGDHHLRHRPCAAPRRWWTIRSLRWPSRFLPSRCCASACWPPSSLPPWARSWLWAGCWIFPPGTPAWPSCRSSWSRCWRSTASASRWRPHTASTQEL